MKYVILFLIKVLLYIGKILANIVMFIWDFSIPEKCDWKFPGSDKVILFFKDLCTDGDDNVTHKEIG